MNDADLDPAFRNMRHGFVTRREDIDRLDREVERLKQPVSVIISRGALEEILVLFKNQIFGYGAERSITEIMLSNLIRPDTEKERTLAEQMTITIKRGTAEAICRLFYEKPYRDAAWNTILPVEKQRQIKQAALDDLIQATTQTKP